MSTETRIAWRFLRRGTQEGRFSAMTVFAWLAIGIGVGAMSSLLSVMYGFETALRDRVLKAYPHVMLKPAEHYRVVGEVDAWTEKLRRLPGVDRALPFLETEMIVQSDNRTLGGVLRGLRQSDFSTLQGQLTQGKLPNPTAAEPEMVLGIELAQRLGAAVGDSVRIISPLVRSGAMGSGPQMETFRVSGLFESGHYEFDQQYLFLQLEDLQDLLRKPGALSGWHIWAVGLEESDGLTQTVEKMAPEDWKTEHWSSFNAALFQSLKLEQYAMFTILSFAIVIAVLNIVITLMMHVTHKRRNIGVLRALGASRAQIRRIFVSQGALLGGLGLILGAVLTLCFVVYVKHFSSYLLPDIYYDRSIPIELRPLSLAAVYLVAVVLIFLGTLYPSSRAASLDPIEAIRE